VASTRVMSPARSHAPAHDPAILNRSPPPQNEPKCFLVVPLAEAELVPRMKEMYIYIYIYLYIYIHIYIYIYIYSHIYRVRASNS